MSEPDTPLKGDDFAQGVALESIADNAMLLGHAQGKPVILVRRANELYAVGATCTHYGGPLAEGLLVGDTVRCPWHHAAFCLRTGEAVRAPALSPIECWRVEQRGGKAYVTEKQADAPARPALTAADGVPESIVIIGGGAAGNAAAETLRREGYTGPVTLLSADANLPCDRPNLSKNFLAGTAPAEWLPLRSIDFYQAHNIDMRLDTRVVGIEPARRRLQLDDGSHLTYGALLLATGAEPIKLDIAGADLPHVHYLRTQADSEALVSRALGARRAVVIGASFIGLEVAASLRARNIEVQVVGRETCVMEKVLGPKVGHFIQALHEQHGVKFHLGTSPAQIDAQGVTLENGDKLPADLVVIGVGVKPALALAEQAGLTMDRGVLVDTFLQTSAPGIFAAGDIARWPDRLSGTPIRVEHWVVAERQGQTAARNLLGKRERYEAVPFFWTEQYDFALAYVGHAEGWDQADIDGSLEARDCTITYRRGGLKLAVAVIHRDLEGLRAEVDFERVIALEASAEKTAP
ncbi:NADPH-dependent 2,4-dienoyl-CoA reductase/sulfur reductase-like enzyme/nitrite reductase/ring-hydroxylating ferredoxin subunit [Polaromonas sp. CG_9.5]|uniref:FAD-dependent oxidoreductase n=1 Tax=Polaromonas sp. CG_9.5 TaxID=3071705 RepID=UPI002DF841AE|nr:NADPH-dependent 2,4-dienoyl-CoA reductase/sulfur reductase-like enzyme/nitrite reductase/ring-hydroxylating ferredoxin subunit [Polaromonas sp. CG_9.5]